ncbi:MAG: DUF4230 domain-containing protein [Treponema sp.]|nr:DUF4230 domain-containing protein [Treponema sp.]
MGLGVGIFVGKKLKFLSKETHINITSTIKEILPVSEFACLVYHYRDVVKHKDKEKILSWLTAPFTGKKAIYTIDGTVKLGFNGKEIKIKTSYNNIVVYMPKITILSHEMHPETFELYDEQTGLFSKYTLKDANDIELERKNEIESKITKNIDLFRQARESANQQFASLLENLPGIKGMYSIVFEWPPLTVEN